MVVRTLFLGTPEFAVPSLEALLKAGPHAQASYEIVGVVTQPDRRAGRGMKPTPSPVKKTALQAGVPVFQPESLRKESAGLHLLRDLQPELMVVVAYGQILPAEFFEFPRFGTLNVHASILPKFRGAAPVIHALLEGARETGVTIMKIDAGMDTGDILSVKAIPIDDEVTAGKLEAQLSRMGARLLLETIPPYLSGDLKPRPQDPGLASYAPRVSREQARIDWGLEARKLHDRIRAFNPRPVAFALLDRTPVKIWRSRLLSAPIAARKAVGTILEIESEYLLVQCGGETSLGLLELQLPGQRRLTARDFANGTHLKAGDRFL